MLQTAGGLAVDRVLKLVTYVCVQPTQILGDSQRMVFSELSLLLSVSQKFQSKQNTFPWISHHRCKKIKMRLSVGLL